MELKSMELKPRELNSREPNSMDMWSLDKLEFEEIRAIVESYALSFSGKAYLAQLKPSSVLAEVRRRLAETGEAKQLLDSGGGVPIPTLNGIDSLLQALGKGFLLTETPLESLRQCLESTLQMQQYLTRKKEVAPILYQYGESLYPLEPVATAIRDAIHLGIIRDDASRELLSIRKRLSIVSDRMRKKMEGLVSKYAQYLQESTVSERSGRCVLAVKRSDKNHVRGAIVDTSASGQTEFVEPMELTSLVEERSGLEIAEEQERNRILAELTALVDTNRTYIERNIETIGVCDFIIAKAKYARAIGGVAPNLTDSGELQFRDARHPKLGKDAVPLAFAIGKDYHGLVLTGPNTGGKTVTLKTVGLLSVMAQCGLLVPVHPESTFPIYEQILVDIGDGQNISQSLSTFSAHIRSVAQILNQTGPRTLVLLDEMASGTDPGEGISLSIAILEKLYTQGATIVATTHFNELKVFAEITPGFENARMEFDVETLAPKYRLKIGEAGESYALVIAAKYGLSEDVISRSRTLMASTQSAKLMNGRIGEAADDMESTQEVHTLPPQTSPVIEPRTPVVAHGKVRKGNDSMPTRPYQVGDRVWVHRLGKSGIIYSLPDSRGNLTVMIQKQKFQLNVKRISLYVPKEELYPDSNAYDLEIVLESKDTRRKRKLMRRRHAPGIVIESQQD